MTDFLANKRKAVRDAARYLGNHVMKDGLIRSYRFHTHYIDRFCHPPAVVVPYPFGKVTPPIEGVKFGYDSTYNFTLTWTPGKLVLSGDIGEMVLTHYHAMATFEDAIDWAQSSDFDYLLGKSNKRPVYNRDETLKAFKRHLYEEIISETLGFEERRFSGNDANGRPTYKTVRNKGALGDRAAWRREEPTWNKRRRAGMTRAEFEQEHRSWAEDKPRVWFIEQKQQGRFDPRFDWRIHWDSISRFWSYPDGWSRFVRAYVSQNRHYPHDVASILTRAGRDAFWEEIESRMDGPESAAETAYIIYGDDPELVYEHTWHDFFQIAAIQHGCRMIAAELWPRQNIAEAAE